MDELEDGLKGLVDKMGKVILNLLCLLDIKNVDDDAAQPIQVLIFVHLFIFYLFCLQTHVAADTAHPWMSLHISVHLVNGLRIWSQTDVQQDGELWFQLIAKSIEKPVMR